MICLDFFCIERVFVNKEIGLIAVIDFNRDRNADIDKANYGNIGIIGNDFFGSCNENMRNFIYNN